jgi:hypothetical protein
VEAFEAFVAVALEADDFVVSPAVKFPVVIKTKRGPQEHGFEVDLVGANGKRLVLASVKSFFGSRGVAAEYVTGESGDVRRRKLYALLNDPHVRRQVMHGAARRYGYKVSQVELRLYVGRFAGQVKGEHEERIRRWAKGQRVGAGTIQVYGLDQIVGKVREAAAKKQYRDNPVLATLKAIEATHELTAFNGGRRLP